MKERERIYGRIAVLECLKARRRELFRLYRLAGAKGLEAIDKAAADMPIEQVSRQDLDRMTKGAVHQGVVLEASPLAPARLSDWLQKHATGDAVLVALDSVEDPHNLGAIARSVSACGAQGLLFTQDRAAPLSPAAIKASAGALEYIDLIQEPNLARALRQLKEHAFWVAGLEADGEKLLWEADLRGRIVLVIGSEGKGMRRLVRESCDFLMRIPLTGPITSLNASVSAAAALIECMRQRQGN